jgi:N-acetylmuramoyl-L-alanine amidase/Phage tail lysozyme
MKYVISSGHGKYVRGASGYIDEVDEARKVVEEVAAALRAGGGGVVTFHDDVSQTQNENLNRIVDFHNSQMRDWDVSVHFNAYQTTSKPMGTEVLYVSSAGETMAVDISDAIADVGFINRGPKKRTDLAFLNGTDEPAILIEVCFVDSKADTDLYRSEFKSICQNIADGLLSDEVMPEPAPAPAPEGVAKAPDIMMRLIRDFDLQDFHAGGVLGSIGHECAWFTIWQEVGKTPPDGGWGWCQWTGSRREDFFRWIEIYGFDEKSDEGNYGFLAHELQTSEKNALKALLETTTLAEATEVFMLKFERPGVPHLDRRQLCAEQAMAEWNNTKMMW